MILSNSAFFGVLGLVLVSHTSALSVTGYAMNNCPLSMTSFITGTCRNLATSTCCRFFSQPRMGAISGNTRSVWWEKVNDCNIVTWHRPDQHVPGVYYPDAHCGSPKESGAGKDDFCMGIGPRSLPTYDEANDGASFVNILQQIPGLNVQNCPKAEENDFQVPSPGSSGSGVGIFGSMSPFKSKRSAESLLDEANAVAKRAADAAYRDVLVRSISGQRCKAIQYSDQIAPDGEGVWILEGSKESHQRLHDVSSIAINHLERIKSAGGKYYASWNEHPVSRHFLQGEQPLKVVHKRRIDAPAAKVEPKKIVSRRNQKHSDNEDPLGDSNSASIKKREITNMDTDDSFPFINRRDADDHAVKDSFPFIDKRDDGKAQADDSFPFIDERDADDQAVEESFPFIDKRGDDEAGSDDSFPFVN